MADIVLKDRDGNPVNHPTDTVSLLMSDGTVQKFVNNDTVPDPVETTIVPDFSAGDMVVVPDDGAVFSKVTVVTPENLKPENIPKDMYIAGVGPGEFEGGGNSNEEPCTFLTYASGYTTKTTSSGSASKTATPTVSIPLGSEVMLVLAGGSLATYTSSGNVRAPMPGNVEEVTNYAVTDGSSNKTISWSFTQTVGGYGAVSACMTVLYKVPGIVLKHADDALIFYGDNTVTAIPGGSKGSFSKFDQITEVDLQRSLISQIPSYAFATLYTNANSLEKVTLPDTVTSLQQSCFEYCAKLTHINLPDKITSIGSYSFRSCQSLNQITLPSSLKSIDTGAFVSCKNISAIAIPAGVTSIGGQAFYGCTALEVVDCSACTSVPTLSGTNAFYNCPSTLQIKVPAALYDEWIAATNWSTYASYIVAV